MWRKLLNIAFLIIGIAFFVKMLMEYDLKAIWSDLSVIRYGFLWIILTWLMVVVADTITWKHTFGEFKNKVPYLNLGLIICAGQSINGVAPSGNLGELVKGKYLAEYIGGSDSVSSLIIFNFLHLAGSIVIITLGAIFSLTLDQIPGYLKILLLAAAAGLIGILVLSLFILKRGLASKVIGFVRKIRIPLKRPEKWIENAAKVDRNIRRFRKDYPGDFWISILAQACSRAGAVVEVYLICLLLGKPISLGMAFFIMSVSQLLLWIFSMVPSQIGVMEQSSDVFFKAMGYQPGAGFAFELVRRARRVVQISFGLIVLLFLSMFRSRRNGEPALATPQTGSEP
jgi:hypothetical protein